MTCQKRAELMADGFRGSCVNRYELGKMGAWRRRRGEEMRLSPSPDTRRNSTHSHERRHGSNEYWADGVRTLKPPPPLLSFSTEIRARILYIWWLTRRVEFLLLLLDGCRMRLDGCGGWLVTFDTTGCPLLLLIPLGRKGPRVGRSGGPRRRMITRRRGYSRRTRRSKDQERLGTGWWTDDPWQVVLDATVHMQWRRIILFRIHRKCTIDVWHPLRRRHRDNTKIGRQLIRFHRCHCRRGFQVTHRHVGRWIGCCCGHQFLTILVFFLQWPSRIIGLLMKSGGRILLLLHLLLLLLLPLQMTHGTTRRANTGWNGGRRPNLSVLIRPGCCCCSWRTDFIRASTFGSRRLCCCGWCRRRSSWRPSRFRLSHFHDRFTSSTISGGGCNSNCWRVVVVRMKGSESASVSRNRCRDPRLLWCRHGVGICREWTNRTTAGTADVSRHVTGWVNTTSSSASRN